MIRRAHANSCCSHNMIANSTICEAAQEDCPHNHGWDRGTLCFLLPYIRSFQASLASIHWRGKQQSKGNTHRCQFIANGRIQVSPSLPKFSAIAKTPKQHLNPKSILCSASPPGHRKSHPDQTRLGQPYVVAVVAHLHLSTMKEVPKPVKMAHAIRAALPATFPQHRIKAYHYHYSFVSIPLHFIKGD